MERQTPMLVVGGVAHEIQQRKVCRWHQAIGSPYSSVVNFHWFFLYDLGACEMVEVLMHAPLVGFGAPPWWCEIAGSTIFV